MHFFDDGIPTFMKYLQTLFDFKNTLNSKSKVKLKASVISSEGDLPSAKLATHTASALSQVAGSPKLKILIPAFNVAQHSFTAASTPALLHCIVFKS